ncbi:hypothetical protein B0H19DRAFT_231469 [Mycena capillaripes]|nr:hypothetical protein B0H19DRAFT_231469 [Mycena capillaripes]
MDPLARTRLELLGLSSAMPPRSERGPPQRTRVPPRPQVDIVPSRHSVPPPRPLSGLLSTNAVRGSHHRAHYSVPSPRPQRAPPRPHAHVPARHDVSSQITDWLAELSVSVPSPPRVRFDLPSERPRPSLPAFLTLNPHHGIVTSRPQADRDGPRTRTSVPPRPRHNVPPPRPQQANPDLYQSPRRSRPSGNTNGVPAQLEEAAPLAPPPPLLTTRNESGLEDHERVELEIPDPERSGLCVICQDEEAIMAVVDCGHLAMCRGCSEQVMRTSPECPLCRTRIVTEARLIRIFKT